MKTITLKQIKQNLRQPVAEPIITRSNYIIQSCTRLLNVDDMSKFFDRGRGEVPLEAIEDNIETDELIRMREQ